MRFLFLRMVIQEKGEIQQQANTFCFSHRSLAEFWHWFVANVPGNSVGEGEEIFQVWSLAQFSDQIIKHKKSASSE